MATSAPVTWAWWTSAATSKIVDHKKDMIPRSAASNVYPNEVEDVLTQMPGCAAVGVPDTKSGEAVKVVLVRKDPNLSEGRCACPFAKPI